MKNDTIDKVIKRLKKGSLRISRSELIEFLSLYYTNEAYIEALECEVKLLRNQLKTNVEVALIKATEK